MFLKWFTYAVLFVSIPFVCTFFGGSMSIRGHSQRTSGQNWDFQTPPPPSVRGCPKALTPPPTPGRPCLSWLRWNVSETQAYTHLDIWTHSQTHSHTHTLTLTHSQTDRHTHKHRHKQTDRQTDTHAHMNIQRRTRTYGHILDMYFLAAQNIQTDVKKVWAVSILQKAFLFELNLSSIWWENPS